MGAEQHAMAHNGGARPAFARTRVRKAHVHELEPMLLVPLGNSSGDLSTLEAGNPSRSGADAHAEKCCSTTNSFAGSTSGRVRSDAGRGMALVRGTHGTISMV